jgi:hypothetical protein
MSKIKTTYIDLVLYCKENNCEIITNESDYINQKGRKTISIISSCKHQIDNVRINDFLIKKKYIVCKPCTTLKNSNRYSDLVTLCISKGCKIVTTEEEFNAMVRRDKFNIISKCGHSSNNVNISGFKDRDQLILCKSCISENRKNFNNNNSEFNSMQIEADSINIIKDNIKDSILEKTVEGCKADIIIKPNSIDENLWLPVQVKGTIKKLKTGYYSFSIHKNYYENTIIILVAIDDKKVWIMDNSIINGKDTIALGGKESIYNKYEVKIEELNEKIIDFYNKNESYYITKENVNIPTSKSQKLEHTSRLLRQKINYLTFIEPEINNITYDFIINNYKIQEKVAIKQTKESTHVSFECYIASFRKHNGRDKETPTTSNRGLSRKAIYTCYERGDNDFYWINLEDSSIFFIIPEWRMIEKKLVNIKTKNESSLYIPQDITKKEHWLNKYIYNYNDDNKEKLLELFKND